MMEVASFSSSLRGRQLPIRITTKTKNTTKHSKTKAQATIKVFEVLYCCYPSYIFTYVFWIPDSTKKSFSFSWRCCDFSWRVETFPFCARILPSGKNIILEQTRVLGGTMSFPHVSHSLCRQEWQVLWCECSGSRFCSAFGITIGNDSFNDADG